MTSASLWKQQYTIVIIIINNTIMVWSGMCQSVETAIHYCYCHQQHHHGLVSANLWKQQHTIFINIIINTTIMI